MLISRKHRYMATRNEGVTLGDRCRDSGASSLAVLGESPRLAVSTGQPAEIMPFVSVVIPCLNEERFISGCLDSIIANEYPKERLEILIIDGMSTDRTRQIVKSYSQRFGFIRLIDNPQKHIPVAMNLGIRHAQGDTIIKIDAHSTYQPDHITLCIRYQEEYGAQNTGGILRILPGASTNFAKAIVIGLGHKFGSGNANIKIGAPEPTWSDTAAFGCLDRKSVV